MEPRVPEPHEREAREASLENKFYCPDVGTVLEVAADAPEERVELVELTVP